MRHPIEKYNEKQAAVLAELPEEERDYMARMFRIGNATYCYHNRVNELRVFRRSIDDSEDAEISNTDDLLEWLQNQVNPQHESRSARELLAIYFEEYLD